MIEKYILYISVLISAILAVFVLTIINKHCCISRGNSGIIDSVNNENRKQMFSVFTIICAICLLVQGFLICKIVDDCNLSFQSQVRPLSTNIFNLFTKTKYPEEIENVDFSLKTNDNSEFSIENNLVLIPGIDKYGVIEFSEESIRDFRIDFSQNTTRVLINDREYVFIIENVSYPASKINPSVWVDDNEDIKKLYMAIPLSKNEELIISTDISDIDESAQIENIVESIEFLSEKVKITDTVHLFVNGYLIDLNEVMYISPLSISLQDYSFLISSLVSQNQISNISMLYTDRVFEFWQTSTKVPADQTGRSVYVRVVDNIRYTLFVKEENLETAIRSIQFEAYE